MQNWTRAVGRGMGFAYLLLALACNALRAASPQDLDTAIAALGAKLAEPLSRTGAKKTSVVDFTDLQGNTTELGRYVAEQLSVTLINSPQNLSVLDRANLRTVLEEHKLTASGIVNPENARKLGKFAGVESIVIGSISAFPDRIVITARAIDTESSQVLGAASVTALRSADVESLIDVAASRPSVGSASTSARLQMIGDSPEVRIEVQSVLVAGNDVVVSLVATRKLKTDAIKIAWNSGAYGPLVSLIGNNGAELQPRNSLGVPTLPYISPLHGDPHHWYRKMMSDASEGPRIRRQIASIPELTFGQPTICTLRFDAYNRPGREFKIQGELVIFQVDKREEIKMKSLIISGSGLAVK